MYSGLVNAFKNKMTRINIDDPEDEEEDPQISVVPLEIKEQLQSLLDEDPDNMTAKPLFERWKNKHGREREYEREKVLRQAKYLRTKMLNDKRKQRRRNMCG